MMVSNEQARSIKVKIMASNEQIRGKKKIVDCVSC